MGDENVKAMLRSYVTICGKQEGLRHSLFELDQRLGVLRAGIEEALTADNDGPPLASPLAYNLVDCVVLVTIPEDYHEFRESDPRRCKIDVVSFGPGGE